MKRVFLALNLPKAIKEELLVFQKKWPRLPIRWVKPENLHLTLLFLGYLDQRQLADVFQKTEEISDSFSPFEISLTKIIYGPPGQKIPRMVWVNLEKTPELLKLQKTLKEEIFSLPSFQYKQKEKRPFCPHITLGRIKVWQFRQLEPEQRPAIEEEISLSFQVSSLEIMESHLKRTGAEYSILKSLQFQAQEMIF